MSALAAMTLEQATSSAPRTEKRDRESPGDKGEASGWRTIPKQKKESEKKKKMKEDRQKQMQREMPAEREVGKKAKNREGPQPRRIRSRGDALIIGVKGEKTTYADLLKRMRDDPKLNELGEKVVKTRRTQSGELLFELKRDPEVKSAAFKVLVETALGSEAQVKALSQETIVEAKNLDEVTTESEVKAVLTRAKYLGDVSMFIRLRKVYGSTQTVSIRLSIASANRLLKMERVKIGWAMGTHSIKSLQVPSRVQLVKSHPRGKFKVSISGREIVGFVASERLHACLCVCGPVKFDGLGMRKSAALALYAATALILACQSGANYVAYDEDLTTIGDPSDLDYLQDEAQRRADYHDAIDRLIASVMNQTEDADTDSDSRKKSNADPVKVSDADAEKDTLKCAANRQPQPIVPASSLTINKCCPPGESFLHESITRCKEGLRRPRLPIISREVIIYDQTCFEFGQYLKNNVTTNGKCIGKHLVFSNDGAMFTMIQNGSLMVSNANQMVIYHDYCVEETGTTVLAAFVCDEIVFPDPFDLVDKLVIGSALVALFLAVLIYAFERNFHTTFGKLIMVHVGLLFVALLLEAALTEFEESIYSTIVFILIEASYVVFVATNLQLLVCKQSDFQKMDTRNVVFVAFGCCVLWVIAVLFTLYCDEILVVLCTIFSSLLFSILVNLVVLRGMVNRRHHLLNSMDSTYEISDSVEFSGFVQYRRELTILSTIAAVLQLLHWIVYAASRYSLLYSLSWCGLTVFVVYVCFRYRSITVLSVGSRSNISNVLRHRHQHHHHQEQQQNHQSSQHHDEQQHQQQHSPHRFEEPSGNGSYQEMENGFHQMQPNSHGHQQRVDNQKHPSLAPVPEESGQSASEDRGK
ncbi:uncharacterized protein LOC128735351 [Sabethes cyaneus]|uniref:uncharacterized protein LOC128735351 n=1 Tax=Sabethes cyaneus TaxID=53552 RepID=UPI00237D55B8|nr:uncharacterized protein LOC128735351 [Sabethes cyaneus]